MSAAIDASVIIAALNAADPAHEACHRLLLADRHVVHAHALSETFSTLTGGRLGIRILAAEAAAILRDQVAPRLNVQVLTASEMLDAYEETTHRGIRGGAIYDYLHLVVARKAGALRFHTLNLMDFQSFHRSGDPDIVHPSSGCQGSGPTG